MVKQRSRLYKRFERQTRRNLVFSLVGILIILFAIFKFGIPLLASFSLFLSGGKASEQTQGNQPNFIGTPVLNPLPSATNSAKIKITGKSQPEYTVDLYFNGNLADKTQTDKDGSFSFDQILLKGNNNIKTKAEKDNKASDFSESLDILFKDTFPKLDIKSPTDGQSFSKDQNFVNVAGSTDSEVRVTINGFWAILDDKNNFSYSLPLQNGENVIKVVATDQAGNKTEKEIKVKYSP